MPALLELQRALRAQMLGTTHGPQHESDELVAIYRNTVRGTLLNALRLSYPAVQRIVGADFFEAALHPFMDEHAPRSAYLNDYGGELAAFLATFEPARSLPYLADVARLEWAVNRALHAHEGSGLDLQRLAALDEAARAQVRLRVHPGVSLLRLQFPADAIWRAVLDQDAAAMAAIDLSSGPVYLLIERAAHGVTVQRLPAPAWQFAARLSAGTPLYAALEEASEHGGEDLNALLAEHLASGRFIAFSSIAEHLP
jgi:hypothetical protein